MRKILSLLAFIITFSVSAQYTPNTQVNYVKYLKTPPVSTYLGDSILVFKNSDKFQYMMPISFLGRKFVPLGGTISGFPLSGDVEVNELATGIWTRGANYPNDKSGISFGEGGVSLYYRDSSTDNSAAFTPTGEGMVITANQGTSLNPTRGIIGLEDYTGQITDLDFTQKKYVDDAIVAASPDLSAYVKGDGTQATAVDLNNQNLTNVGGITANGNITGDNLTGQNSGDESATTIGAIVVGATSKTTPVDADLIPISDSEASGIIKKLSFANLKTYLSTLYQSVLVSGTNIKTINGNSLLGSGNVAVGDALVANRIDQNNAATTSAQLASVISDETGSGALVFAGSPDFTGAPTAPTAATGTNTTQLASTAFVQQEMAAASRQIVNDGTTYTLTGTTSETILYSKSIPANTFVSGKGWNLVLGFTRPTGTAQTVLRVYLNTSNAIGGVQIGTITLINTNTWGKLSRSYQIEGTTIKGFPPTTNNADDAMASSVAILSGTYNPTSGGFLIVTAQPNNAGDSVSQIFAMAEK